MANHAKLYDDAVAMAKKPVKPPVERYEGKNGEKTVPKAIGRQTTAGMQQHIKLAFSALHFSATTHRRGLENNFQTKQCLMNRNMKLCETKQKPGNLKQ